MKAVVQLVIAAVVGAMLTFAVMNTGANNWKDHEPQHEGLSVQMTNSKESGLRTCTSNQYVDLFTSGSLERLENMYKRWRGNIQLKVRDMLNSVVRKKDRKNAYYFPARRDVFSLLNPLVTCAVPLSRWGESKDDGGKWLCGMEEANRDNDKCVVYSVGGHNQWDFEEAVLKRLPHCEVHTFDCTINANKKKPGPVHFHKWCLAGDDLEIKSQYSLQTIMTRLGHDHLDLMKFDAEGWEHDSFRGWLFGTEHHPPLDNKALPKQLSFELHSKTNVKVPWHPRMVSLAEDALLVYQMYEAGYRSVSREDNPKCSHCSEFTMVRFQC